MCSVLFVCFFKNLKTQSLWIKGMEFGLCQSTGGATEEFL